MVRRGFWLYVIVELAAAAALFWAVGPGWAVAVLLGTFLVGLVLVGSQFRRQVASLRMARGNPPGAVADGLLVGLGGVLMLIPGLVSSAMGALMLLPPTRSAVRPVATYMILSSMPTAAAARPISRSQRRATNASTARYRNPKIQVTNSPLCVAAFLTGTAAS